MLNSKTLLIQDLRIVVDTLTALEWLDLEIFPEMSAIELTCRTVAYAVSDWNGQGRIDPMTLVGDRKLHNVVAALNAKISDLEMPIVEVVKEGEGLLLIGEDFSARMIYPTILELIDILDKHSGLLRSEQKVAAIAALVTEWQGEPVTDEMSFRAQMIADRDSHNLISAIDKALEPFFQSPPIAEDPAGSVLDGGGDEWGPDDAGSSEVGEGATFNIC